MDELWIYCEICDGDSPHLVLKSRTSENRGFVFQGIVQCLECNNKRNSEIKESLPLNLRLRISDDDRTVKGNLEIDAGVLLEVGQTRPHPGGLVLITSLELGDKRLEKTHAQEGLIVWVKRATHAKVRFVIHLGESTKSFKELFSSDMVFKVGMRTNVGGREVIVKTINLYGGKSVKATSASNVSRVICYYSDGKKYGRRN